MRVNRIILTILLILAIVLVIVMLLSKNGNSNYTKDRLIEVFNENYQDFVTIRDYIEGCEGTFYATKSGCFVTADGSNEQVKVEVPIQDELKNVLGKLRFDMIIEKREPSLEGDIVFSISTGREDQGIIYSNKAGVKYGAINEQIKENWYYYWIGGT